MTTVGENRTAYSAQVEARPSRFDPEVYGPWADRADAWAARG